MTDAVALAPPAPAARIKVTTVLRTALTLVLTGGLLVAGFALYVYGLSALQEHRAQHFLYEEFRGLVNSASPVAPAIGGRIGPGTPVALLTVPEAGVRDVIVVEGTTPADTAEGPGHLRNSPLPGQFGDALVFGRSTTAGAPFAHLGALRAGDAMSVVTGQGAFRYVVVDRRRAGAPFPALPASGALLTLVTETGASAFGGRGALLYVDAALVGHAQLPPPGRPATVSASEIEGADNGGALGPALGWLAVVALALVAGQWLRRRWGTWPAWLVTAPVVLWLAWELFSEAAQLLPNVY